MRVHLYATGWDGGVPGAKLGKDVSQLLSERIGCFTIIVRADLFSGRAILRFSRTAGVVFSSEHLHSVVFSSKCCLGHLHPGSGFERTFSLSGRGQTNLKDQILIANDPEACCCEVCLLLYEAFGRAP